MASSATRSKVPRTDQAGSAALQHLPWNSARLLSRVLPAIEQFLGSAGFDRAPWLVVAFAAGIVAWFAMPTVWDWTALLMLCLALSLAALVLLKADGPHPHLRLAAIVLPLLLAGGCLTIWAKSTLIGAVPIAKPVVATIDARVLARQDEPARDRIRIVLATREPGTGRAIRVRVNLPQAQDVKELAPGADIRLKVRLMPPAPPMLPGAYDFARTAWFAGLAGTGSVIGPIVVRDPGSDDELLSAARSSLAGHVRARLPGGEGGIAAALASGDRGGITDADEAAMRDSGLSHLLSISGLHVSAVVGAAYIVVLRLLALFPWLALRVRLPIVAAGSGALAGLGYTILTGSEVPTVRSCVGALLVLLALVLGREALSLRMLAVAAFVVLLFWPEAVVGPSFQLSFAAVAALIALSGASPVRRFLAPREEGWGMRGLRHLALLLLTGIVIEMALTPIGLFHFHRAGAYGAAANVIAIPLTTLVIMPLEALALVLDIFGLGAPVWWLTGKALSMLLGIAHWVASRPGAITMLPAMGGGSFALFVCGGLWLALWSGKVRLLGLIPAVIGALSLATLRSPDIFISGDGRHVGIAGEAKGELLVLRDSRSEFVRDNLTELAGMNGDLRMLADWPGARCNAEFCTTTLNREGREWHLLLTRGRTAVPERALAAACDRSDIVIGDRWLPRSCRPRWIKADRFVLSRTGGLTIDLLDGDIRTVAETQGRHGWWRGPV